jgi:hypothetical protein
MSENPDMADVLGDQHSAMISVVKSVFEHVYGVWDDETGDHLILGGPHMEGWGMPQARHPAIIERILWVHHSQFEDCVGDSLLDYTLDRLWMELYPDVAGSPSAQN